MSNNKKIKPDKTYACRVLVPLKIYPFTIYFSLNETDKDCKKKIKEFGVKNIGDSYKLSSAGCFVFYGTNGNLGLVRCEYIPYNPFYMGVLIHETTHIVNSVLNTLGFKLRHASGEAWSYLHGYLVEEVLKQLEDHIFIHK